MKRGHKVLQAIGELGLLSLLVVGGLNGVAWADDLTAKQTESAAQSTPIATALPAPPDLTANPEVEKSDPGKNGKQADDKKTARAKLLAILLKLFDGHRGGVH